MPGPHQVTAGVFAGPDQVAGRFLGTAGHRDRGDLIEAQQPREVDRVFGVLTRSPAGRCSLEGAATTHRIPCSLNDLASPNPVGPAS